MPREKVYFYRALVGRDGDGRPVDFGAAAAFAEVGQLSFFDEDNGRYLDTGDGGKAFCTVDRLKAPIRVRIARSRRSHLPPVERAGKLQDLAMPPDSGLAEQSFLVFFETGIVGCLYNSFSPRVSVLRTYVRARCGDEHSSVDFEPLLRQDVLEKIDDLEAVRLVELGVLRGHSARIARAAPSLARAVQSLEEFAPQVSIILQPEPHARSWLDGSIMQSLRRLAGLPDVREIATHFHIKGLTSSGRLDEIDVLKDKLVVYADVDYADAKSSALNARTAFRVIEEAYAGLADHLEAASSVV